MMLVRVFLFLLFLSGSLYAGQRTAEDIQAEKASEDGYCQEGAQAQQDAVILFCALLEAFGGGDNTELIAAIEALCDKTEANGVTLAAVVACLEDIKELPVDIFEGCISGGDPVLLCKFADGSVATLAGKKVDASEVTFCEESQLSSDCWQTQFHYGGWENTGTHFSSGYTVEVTNSDDTITIVDLPAGANWGDQMDAWTAALWLAYPDACEVTNHWWEWRPAFLPNTGIGTVPPADFDFPQARGQFVQFTVCPGGVIPVRAVITAATTRPGDVGKDILIGTGVGEVTYLTRCVDCVSGDVSWLGGNPTADQIKCAIPCTKDFAEVPVPVCSNTPIQGFDCIYPEDADGNVDYEATPTQMAIVALYTACPGELPKVVYYTTDEDGNLDEYELLGVFGDENCVAIAVPTECESDGERCIEIEFHIAGGDNNYWPTRGALLWYNAAVDFETTLNNGTVVTWSQVPTGGWSAQVVANSAAQLAAIKAAGGMDCDGGAFVNRLPPPAIVAGLPVAPFGSLVDNVYQRGWYIACCDAGWLPAKTEVVSHSTNAAFVGRVHTHGQQTGSWVGVQRTLCGEDVGFPIGADGEPFTFPYPPGCVSLCDAAAIKKFCELLECFEAVKDVYTDTTEGCYNIRIGVAPESSQPTDVRDLNGNLIASVGNGQFDEWLVTQGFVDDGTSSFTKCVAEEDLFWIDSNGNSQPSLADFQILGGKTFLSTGSVRGWVDSIEKEVSEELDVLGVYDRCVESKLDEVIAALEPAAKVVSTSRAGMGTSVPGGLEWVSIRNTGDGSLKVVLNSGDVVELGEDECLNFPDIEGACYGEVIIGGGDWSWVGASN